ncbi:MAG: hypothetical protein Fur0037_06920 [Planctomycetota bacterium]
MNRPFAFCSLFALLCCTLAVPLGAQGVLALSGTYRVVGITSDAPCSPNTSPSARAITNGTITFSASGTFSWSFVERTVCQGAPPSVSTDSGTTGCYATSVHGVVDADWGIAGRDIDGFQMRSDGEVLIAAAHATNAPARSFIAIKTSSGQTNATLAGSYHMERLAHDYGPNGLTVTVDLGVGTFSANGTFSEGGDRYSIPANTTARYSGNGAFAVQPDGTLDVGGATSNGIVSSTGEIASWILSTGQRTEWVIALRQGTSRSESLLTGRFRLAAHQIHADPAPIVDGYTTQWGEVEATRLGPGTVAVAGSMVFRDMGGSIWTIPAQVSIALEQDPALPAGRFQILFSGNDPPLRGAVSESGRYLVIHEGVGLYATFLMGVRKPEWCLPYGPGTAGTNGLVPRLDGDSFPNVGNSSFRLDLSSALASAGAVLSLSLRPGMTPLAGGHLWIDPTRATSLFVLTDPSGHASQPLPIPAAAALAGTRLFGQCLVFDPGGTAGLALSNALRIQVDL